MDGPVFRYGPFEWAWRCATYRMWQPLRQKALKSEAQ